MVAEMSVMERGSLYNRKPGNPLIMGILNTTPDSFSDGGTYLETDLAVQGALRMIDEGADIIDIGGESTRPPGADYGSGSDSVALEQELLRTIPVIEKIVAESPEALISIDTMKPEVARQALDAGARIVNDVSGGQFDPEIWSVAADHDAPYVLMHGHYPGNRIPAGSVEYGDVVEEVFGWLEHREAEVRRAGVTEVIVDPGIGFAKGVTDSAELLRNLPRLGDGCTSILIGLSRKSMVGRLLGGLPVEARLHGSIGAAVAASLNGASILRVHDVRQTVETFRLFSSLWSGSDETG